MNPTGGRGGREEDQGGLWVQRRNAVNGWNIIVRQGQVTYYGGDLYVIRRTLKTFRVSCISEDRR